MAEPSLPLDLASMYLAGWELRVNQGPIEEYILDLGGGQWAHAARAPVEMQIARGDTVAATFKLIDEEYNPEGILEFIDSVQRAKAGG